jgi:DNA repair exonuclease SbcCD ATPase subunit
MTGCASLAPEPVGSQPYFTVEQGEKKAMLALAKKQDTVVARCGELNTCDHAYFTRALIALYESQESAVKYFEKVIAAAPRGQLAATSRLWLQLLRQYPVPSDRSWVTAVMLAPAVSDGQIALGQASDRLVRDLLDRELVIQQLRAVREADSQAIEQLQRDLAERDRRTDGLIGRKEGAKPPADSGTVQSLQRQLAEREKKIDELYNQLEALKRIDQETREKIRPIRPPSTVSPHPTPESATTP